jgi:hypothetical protein
MLETGQRMRQRTYQILFAISTNQPVISAIDLSKMQTVDLNRCERVLASNPEQHADSDR